VNFYGYAGHVTIFSRMLTFAGARVSEREKPFLLPQKTVQCGVLLEGPVANLKVGDTCPAQIERDSFVLSAFHFFGLHVCFSDRFVMDSRA